LKKLKIRLRLIANIISFRLKALFNGASISLFSEVRIYGKGRLVIGKGVVLQRGCTIHVEDGALLVIKDGVWIGPYSTIYVLSSVSIGEGTRIAHQCTITDNDYLIKSGSTQSVDFSKRKASPIKIMSGVWLCANSMVLRGSNISSGQIIKPFTCVRRK
jgi:acetyltransferase-like isoleucine patch superfamily enzyme